MSCLEESNLSGGGLVIGRGKGVEAKGHEEKKESSVVHLSRPGAAAAAPAAAAAAGGGGGGGSGLDREEEPAIVDIDSLLSRHFESLDELNDTLEELGLGDEKFKLDENGFPVLPGKKHNRGTASLAVQLQHWNKGWSKGWLGIWGFVCNDNRMEVPGFTLTGRQKSREPNVAFWAYPRCEKRAGEYFARDRPDGANFEIDPDVAFQFSDTHGFPEEQENMDLIMQGAIGAGNPGPRLGILIKIRNDGAGNNTGFDIYTVPRGATVFDAINQTNGATHRVYTHGQDDVILEISPEEMGIEKKWVYICRPFKLSMKLLFVHGNF